MPIPAPAPSLTTDENPQTGSPFALRINGAWVTLEGVTPGVAVTPDRPRSENTSVDGHRWAQQASRAAREWTLDWRHATPAAMAAVQLAAEAPGDVWLLDGTSAAANMLHPRDCYGHDLTAAVLDCSGVPLRALPVGAEVTCEIRGDVVMGLALWTDAAAGTPVATATWPGGSGTLTSVAAGSPARSELVFAAATDGTLTVTIDAANVSGLQLVEGDLPATWLAGERTPCKVSVADPSRTLTMLGRSDYSVTLREVG